MGINFNIEEAKRLRALDWSWRKIDAALGLSRDEARLVLDPEYAARKMQYWRDRSALRREAEKAFATDPLNLRLGNGPRPSNDILAARGYRLSIPHRDLTGELMGDPRVGMSALDRKSLACAKAVSAVSDNTYVASGVCQPSEAIGLSQTSVGKLPRIAIPSTSNGVGG